VTASLAHESALCLWFHSPRLRRRANFLPPLGESQGDSQTSLVETLNFRGVGVRCRTGLPWAAAAGLPVLSCSGGNGVALHNVPSLLCLRGGTRGALWRGREPGGRSKGDDQWNCHMEGHGLSRASLPAPLRAVYS
jgi:hypothetical protein